MRCARSIAALGAAFVVFGGCKHREAPAPAAARPFLLADAMTQWYGRYDAADRTARANLPAHPSADLTGSWFAPRDPVDITVVFDADYAEGGHPRHVIVTAAVPHRSDKPGRPGDSLFRCVLCRPVIGMAVFSRLGGTWILEHANSAVDLAGGNGRAPAVRLVELGPAAHGIRLEGHIDADDFASASLSILVPWHGDVARAFSGPTYYTNGQACGPQSPLRDPCFAWHRADSFVRVPAQEYDDLVLTGSGTQPPPEIDKPRAPAPRRRGQHAPPALVAALPYTAVERLRFHEGRYLPLPGTDTEVPPIFSY